ncbi:hypothetical protein [Spirosoma validum]|uniref:Lipocalin-like domain-containing protein n=1 Tax=Spirosoma validum TaxID=2771355 RepID=A0A927B6V2_9BACT|nr:hypothetical protein [Spirosoma validum]MBD2756464.1 hypothetical protein [Spirosoma validum]
MKAKSIHTTRLLMLLALGSMYVVGCKKSETTTPPDLAANLVGTYRVTAIGGLPANLPATPTAASVVVARNGSALDQVQITAAYSITSAVGGQSITDSKTINLQQSGTNVDLYDGTTKVGYWSNNTINATDYPFLTAKISFTASK